MAFAEVAMGRAEQLLSRIIDRRTVEIEEHD